MTNLLFSLFTKCYILIGVNADMTLLWIVIQHEFQKHRLLMLDGEIPKVGSPILIASLTTNVVNLC